MPHKYPFVVISGIIGAGKSTLTQRLSEEISKKGKPCKPYFERVSENPYLENFYTAIKRYQECPSEMAYQQWAFRISFAMQIHLLTRRYRDHKQIQYSQDHISIQDRSIFEDKIFVEMLHKSGLMDSQDREEYFELFEIMSLHFKYPDVIFFLKVTPETALKRIETRSRAGEDKISIEYLRSLEIGYNAFLEEIKRYSEVVVVDWNEEHGDLGFFVNRILK